jgi:hypothetical protein
MATPLVCDELWAVVAPLLPPAPAKPKGGRPPIPHRAALTGIVFVLKSGIPWEILPNEMGCGSGMTCWRRLRDWQDAGVWDPPAPRTAESPGRCRPHRLAPGFTRQRLRAGQKGAKRPGRIRPIAANRARSTTVWSTATARRSPRS